jgi:transposase
MDTPHYIREHIVFLSENLGKSVRTIAADLEVPKSTVGRIIQLYKKSGNTYGTRKGKLGRRYSQTENDQRVLVRASKVDPKATAGELRQQLPSPQHHVSLTTVRKALRNHGRKCYRPISSPCLYDSQQKVRQRWAQVHVRWTNDDWRKVIFSDESYFEIAGRKSQYVRRDVGEKIKPAHTTPRRAFTQRILVWACFCEQGPGPLAIITGTMKTANYINTIETQLRPHLPVWFPDNNFIFQQDNAPCHKSAATTNFFHAAGIQVMQWPPYSPDLNPIENLWGILKKQVGKHHYTNRVQLEAKIREIWTTNTKISDACRELSMSMARRVSACVSARGGPLHY